MKSLAEALQRSSPNPFMLFEDGELEALTSAIDALAPQVAISQEPELTIVHAFNNELGRRRTGRQLEELRRRWGRPAEGNMPFVTSALPRG